jgi:uncharacterized protein (TIGR02145 family)
LSNYRIFDVNSRSFMDRFIYAALSVLLFACGIANTQKQENSQTKSEKKKIEFIEGEFKDSRDGTNYLTYKYPNGQEWMVENAVYFKDSTVKRFNKHSGTNQDEDYMTAKLYDKESPNVGMNTYDPSRYRDVGLYYDYYSASLVCPQGFHLSTRKDWLNLMLQFDKSGEKYFEGGINNLGKIPEHGFNLTINPKTEKDIAGWKTQLYWVAMTETDIKNISPGLCFVIKVTTKEGTEDIFIEEQTTQTSKGYYPCRCVKD